MVIRFHHVHLKSRDVDKAAQFYVDAFGAKKVREWTTERGAKWIVLDLGGQRINMNGLAPGEALPTGTSDQHLGMEHFGVEPDDLEEALERVTKAGGKILQPPPPPRDSSTRVAFIEAPDSVRIEIIKPAPGT